MSAVLIVAAPVERDEMGEWTHPGMPMFDEGETADWKAWLAAQGLEVSRALLEYADCEDPAYVAYYENEAGFADWNPAPPDGDGWFVLAVGDTEDGPCYCWARRTEVRP